MDFRFRFGTAVLFAYLFIVMVKTSKPTVLLAKIYDNKTIGLEVIRNGNIKLQNSMSQHAHPLQLRKRPASTIYELDFQR